MMNFVAIDVETANADLASICQIGIAKYNEGILSDEWRTYVNPEDFFDDFNISIHGIDESIVQNAPKFSDLGQTLSLYLNEAVIVCHTHFDRVAIYQAMLKYKIRIPEITWLDSAKVARRTWPICSQKGYGLYNVCNMLGYNFQHHDALEDAKALAHILLAANNKTGIDINGWIKKIQQPIGASCSSTISRAGSPEGALSGEVVVFTGTLEILRREAADLAASIGCEVRPSVTNETSIVVVGDQDIKRLAGHKKSSKHRKAEALIEKGVPIKILKESDFKTLVSFSE